MSKSTQIIIATSCASATIIGIYIMRNVGVDLAPTGMVMVAFPIALVLVAIERAINGFNVSRVMFPILMALAYLILFAYCIYINYRSYGVVGEKVDYYIFSSPIVNACGKYNWAYSIDIIGIIVIVLIVSFCYAIISKIFSYAECSDMIFERGSPNILFAVISCAPLWNMLSECDRIEKSMFRSVIISLFITNIAWFSFQFVWAMFSRSLSVVTKLLK